MPTLALYALAALRRNRRVFCVWAVFRLQQSPLWLLPGLACLAAFAWLLTLVDSAAAGRAYAAYGGVYIVASLLWLWLVEAVRPDRFDVIGAMVALTGAAIILAGPPLTPALLCAACILSFACHDGASIMRHDQANLFLLDPVRFHARALRAAGLR